MSIADERAVPFVWVTTRATRTLREQVGQHGDDPGLSQVRVTYDALVEIANERRARSAVGADSDEFTVERQKIARYAGVSERTVKRALRTLERLQLVRSESPEGQGRNHIPNRYVLTEPGDSESDRGTQGPPPRGTHVPPTTKEGKKKPKKACVRESVNRKAVTDDELALVAAVVQSFNEIAGTALRPDPHITPIVGRIREWPNLTAVQHRKVIAAVFAGDHWWGGRPGPKIIYGNAAQFEQSIELARAEAKKPVEEDMNDRADRIRREQGLD